MALDTLQPQIVRPTVMSRFHQWWDRVRRSAVIVLAAALGLVALVAFGDGSPLGAAAVFVCILAAVLMPWQTSGVPVPISEAGAVAPLETAVVRAVIDAMPDCVVLLDPAGRVLQLNAAALELAPALRRGEFAQFALRAPEIITALREAIASASLRRATYYERGAVARWMELTVSPVRVPKLTGEPDVCMLLTFHDQTPLRRVEEMRADFVANASHELRTPLAALSGFIDTLRGPARDDVAARARFLDIMHAQASRMARLIEDLLSLSRVELSAHIRPEAMVDLALIIRQVADGLEPLARERDVAIELDVAQSPAIVAGDREELLRLFENLIENALKYGASGRRVDVRLTNAATTEGGSEIRAIVRDYGPGIAPEHLPRLTERFYRVDVGDSRSQGGTGLGLSLVKHIVARHRGRLLIESVLGKGATFTACFPQPRIGIALAPVRTEAAAQD